MRRSAGKALRNACIRDASAGVISTLSVGKRMMCSYVTAEALGHGSTRALGTGCSGTQAGSTVKARICKPRWCSWKKRLPLVTIALLEPVDDGAWSAGKEAHGQA